MPSPAAATRHPDIPDDRHKQAPSDQEHRQTHPHHLAKPSTHYGYGHAKPWKSKKRKGYKHGRNWDHHGYPPYGHDYGYPSYHRPLDVKGLIIDAVLRRLLHRR